MSRQKLSTTVTIAMHALDAFCEASQVGPDLEDGDSDSDDGAAYFCTPCDSKVQIPGFGVYTKDGALDAGLIDTATTKWCDRVFKSWAVAQTQSTNPEDSAPLCVIVPGGFGSLVKVHECCRGTITVVRSINRKKLTAKRRAQSSSMGRGRPKKVTTVVPLATLGPRDRGQTLVLASTDVCAPMPTAALTPILGSMLCAYLRPQGLGESALWTFSRAYTEEFKQPMTLQSALLIPPVVQALKFALPSRPNTFGDEESAMRVVYAAWILSKQNTRAFLPRVLSQHQKPTVCVFGVDLRLCASKIDKGDQVGGYPAYALGAEKAQVIACLTGDLIHFKTPTPVIEEAKQFVRQMPELFPLWPTVENTAVSGSAWTFLPRVHDVVSRCVVATKPSKEDWALVAEGIGAPSKNRDSQACSVLPCESGGAVQGLRVLPLICAAAGGAAAVLCPTPSDAGAVERMGGSAHGVFYDGDRDPNLSNPDANVMFARQAGGVPLVALTPSDVEAIENAKEGGFNVVHVGSVMVPTKTLAGILSRVRVVCVHDASAYRAWDVHRFVALLRSIGNQVGLRVVLMDAPCPWDWLGPAKTEDAVSAARLSGARELGPLKAWDWDRIEWTVQSYKGDFCLEGAQALCSSDAPGESLPPMLVAITKDASRLASLQSRVGAIKRLQARSSSPKIPDNALRVGDRIRCVKGVVAMEPYPRGHPLVMYACAGARVGEIATIGEIVSVHPDRGLNASYPSSTADPSGRRNCSFIMLGLNDQCGGRYVRFNAADWRPHHVSHPGEIRSLRLDQVRVVVDGPLDGPGVQEALNDLAGQVTGGMVVYAQ